MENSKVFKMLKKKLDKADDLRRKQMKTLFKKDDEMTKFSGDDEVRLQSWIDKVEDQAEEYGWTGVQTMFFAKRWLSGSAKIVIDFERPVKSWKMMKKVLSEEFKEEGEDDENDFLEIKMEKSKVEIKKKSTEKKKVVCEDIKVKRNNKSEKSCKKQKKEKSRKSEVKPKEEILLKFAEEINDVIEVEIAKDLENFENEDREAEMKMVLKNDLCEEQKVEVHEVVLMISEAVKIEELKETIKTDVTRGNVKMQEVKLEPREYQKTVQKDSNEKKVKNPRDEQKMSMRAALKLVVKFMMKMARFRIKMSENVKMTIPSTKTVKRKKRRGSWKFDGVDGHPND